MPTSTNPEVIKINSVLDIVAKVEDYYLKGYVVGAIHPVIQPMGHRKHLPASHLYRVVLSRLKANFHTHVGGKEWFASDHGHALLAAPSIQQPPVDKGKQDS
ncbi:hypothetical protein U0070_015273 [Myodes glareolus]|uniref:Uncharacterized protein n=1 Tax=Myodes glareolus TaxID=447135 RepID=A0AAW0K0W7_MYOGA